jgi:hypothetical protein
MCTLGKLLLSSAMEGTTSAITVNSWSAHGSVLVYHRKLFASYVRPGCDA